MSRKEFTIMVSNAKERYFIDKLNNEMTARGQARVIHLMFDSELHRLATDVLKPINGIDFNPQSYVDLIEIKAKKVSLLDKIKINIFAFLKGIL